MTTAGWRMVGEIEAGGVWAAVADHPPVEALERTHCEARATLGLWLSPQPNESQGRFLDDGRARGHRRMGRIVAIPENRPLHVRAAATPARRMLHIRLPARIALPGPAAHPLARCLDVRNAAIGASLARLAREVIEPGFATAALVEGLGLTIAADLARDLAEPGGRATGGLAGWQLRRIDDHLRAGNWDSNVGDLARLCGISPGHAMRAFRQSTGRSIAGHIAGLRIARARELLDGETHSIGEVAATLRFATASAFSAAFRRACGESPNGFRQRARGGAL